MSNKSKNLNLVHDDKKPNINLISIEKSPNKNLQINYNTKNNNFNAFNNKRLIPKIPKKDNLLSNDLLNSKNEDELNYSNINIEKTQKFINNADILFTEEDENENENEKENENNNNIINNQNNSRNININNSISKDLSNSISINEEKRIEFANNLFDKSLTSSIRSNTSNDANDASFSLVSEKRREVADKLFQSFSDIGTRKKSLNETFKSFNSNQSSKTNMSHVIKNLSGSNMGLNINAIANKYANLDKGINEDLESSVINNKENKENIINNNNNNDYDNDIDEKNEDEICFNKNLIDLGKLGNDINKSNNLNHINASIKKDNNLIKSLNKNDLLKTSKEINDNNNKYFGNESKKNILEKNENNDMNNSISEMSIGNIVIDDLPKVNNKNKNEEDKKNIIDESIQKEKISINANKNKPIKKSLIELFKKNDKNKFIKEKKIGMIEKEDSEDDTSNDILNKKIQLNRNENNESSFLTNNKIEARISSENENINKLNKKTNFNNKHKRIQLIIEKSQEKESWNNTEEKDKNDQFINKNDKNKLISDKNIIIKGGDRNTLISENDKNKYIKLKKKGKDEIEDENEINDNDEDSIKKNQSINKINLNQDKSENDISFDNNKNIIYFKGNNFNNEKRFKIFLKDKNLYYNDNIYDKNENENDLKQIKQNTYFENNIFKQETIYDILNKNQKKNKFEIPFYFDIMDKNYEKNKNNFNLLFQFVSNNDKEKVFNSYKNILNYNIKNYHINPNINEINDFYKSFKIENKNKNKNICYIRYSIDENEGDTFYKCFMFSLFENYFLNKNKENIYILILDIFKLYDLSPSIFNSIKNNNINNILVIFALIRDYIELNLWDMAYDLFLSFYSQIDIIFVRYIKYNLFLYLSKLYCQINEKKLLDNELKYLNHYKKLLINYNEPYHIIFQLIPYIFGINLELIYYENKNEEEILTKNLLFDLPKNIYKKNIETIHIIYYNNCYHIGYAKNFLNENDKILKKLKNNLNKLSLIQYIKSDQIFCEICEKNIDSIEIINENNKRICQECLSSQIDEYLNKRISFINEDYKSNYINYSYYLRPIELIVKEPISIKDNIENNSLIIKNSDYFQIFHKTFSQRISQLFKAKKSLKNSINSINNNNKINIIDIPEINNIENNESCVICKKTSNILTSECGCKFCEECLYDIIMTITSNQIILNGYEKMQLQNNDSDKCPICQMKLNLQYLIMLFEGKGRDFGTEYNEAKVRMANYIKTICFICQKKFDNEKSLEVSHNSKREMLKINVMINSHCIKDSKKNNEINNNYKKEKDIDYSENAHVVCMNCYKKNKNTKFKEIKGVQYKVFMCEICGIRHYISCKEWNKWSKNDACCKCIII